MTFLSETFLSDIPRHLNCETHSGQFELWQESQIVQGKKKNPKLGGKIIISTGVANTLDTWYGCVHMFEKPLGCGDN